MPTAEERAFLDAIREEPADDAPRLIFADWLDDRGDPRGEFIRLQCALARLPADSPDRDELAKREKAVLERHQQEWTAPLRGLAHVSVFRRGLIELVSVDAAAFIERGAELFEYGPIRRVRFIDASRCFAKLVQSPFLAEIAEIDLYDSGLGNGGVSQLARSSFIANVEALNIGRNNLTDQGLRTVAGMSQLTSLRKLELNDNEQLGAPGIRSLADSPYLASVVRLDLSGTNLNDAALKCLINGDSLKRLNSVALQSNNICDEGIESLAGSELLGRMLARSTSLNLSNNTIGPMGIRAFAESEVIEPLEVLDLSANAIGDAGLASLSRSPYLRNLKDLNVQENRISDEGVLALARSRVPETLEVLDLRGNFVTADSLMVVDDAAKAYDWQKKIEYRTDPGPSLALATTVDETKNRLKAELQQDRRLCWSSAFRRCRTVL